MQGISSSGDRPTPCIVVPNNNRSRSVKAVQGEISQSSKFSRRARTLMGSDCQFISAELEVYIVQFSALSFFSHCLRICTEVLPQKQYMLP